MRDLFESRKEAVSLPSGVAIRAKDLGLRFYRNPNQAFTAKGMYRNLFERKYHEKNESAVYRWVWRHLNFDIHVGDIVAIMGPNGEGKTTLLRALAGLLAVDEGTAILQHRPYLLSAGLGFRDELNGYENIRLGGLFLGLPLGDLKLRVQEIADFAELSDEAMRKPMKYYSDGMRARLVFSVATAIDQKVLFLDEILGAGDVGFQRKARARMDQIIQSAKTILLVSHSTQFVRETATKAMLLHNGNLATYGDTEPVVSEYERICNR
jgi:ABC-type polysaccharide/polyol phosphate transport system ATPase subunit